MSSSKFIGSNTFDQLIKLTKSIHNSDKLNGIEIVMFCLRKLWLEVKTLFNFMNVYDF